MYRLNNKNLEVFLVHPGGPFFAKRDNGIWSIPKGLQEDNEDLLKTAKREFYEESSIDSGPFQGKQARMTELGFVEYNNKKVHCWAFENNITDEEIKKVFKSNLSL